MWAWPEHVGVTWRLGREREGGKKEVGRRTKFLGVSILGKWAVVTQSLELL